MMLVLASILLSITVALGASDCPREWYKVQNKCYYVANENNTLYHNRRLCAKLNATLATIHSREENDMLASILPRGASHWIGLQKEDVTMFSWADGSRVDFTRWAANQPRFLSMNMPWGVVMNSGLWLDTAAETSFGELCQIVLPAGKSGLEARLDHVEKRLEKSDKAIQKLNKMYKSLIELQKSTYGQVHDLSKNITLTLLEIVKKMASK